MDEKHRRLVRQATLTGICSRFSPFQLGSLTIMCQVQATRIPDVLRKDLGIGEVAFLDGLLHQQDGRADILQVIDLEQHARRQPAIQAGIIEH